MKMTPRWSQWKRERRCYQAIGHCYHAAPANVVGWDCCECGRFTEGVPRETCRICNPYQGAPMVEPKFAFYPRRDDDVAAWLKRQRDSYEHLGEAWATVDWLLDDYRERADHGVRLGQEHDRG